MGREWLIRLIQAAAITITIAAVCQELEKPKGERQWHGKLGIIPYDFRLPTLEGLKESYWNYEDSRIFTPRPLGIGWGINFYALLEKLRLIGESYASEEDFLMPTRSLREVLEHRPVMEP
jgi:hypothetical protein